jgi:catechol 2,3-dioxygenase-like lactoylglutathione lyase family enzyme
MVMRFWVNQTASPPEAATVWDGGVVVVMGPSVGERPWRRQRFDEDRIVDPAVPSQRMLRSMRLIRIDHVSLNVEDRPRSLAFYEEVLGLRAAAAPGPADEPVFVGHDSARLGLFADRAPGLRHVALATDAAGLRSVRERVERLAIAWTPERHRDHESIYFRDPDGVTVEVMVPAA